jgi:hypothetical protein
MLQPEYRCRYGCGDRVRLSHVPPSGSLPPCTWDEMRGLQPGYETNDIFSCSRGTRTAQAVRSKDEEGRQIYPFKKAGILEEELLRRWQRGTWLPRSLWV